MEPKKVTIEIYKDSMEMWRVAVNDICVYRAYFKSSALVIVTDIKEFNQDKEITFIDCVED